MSTPDAPGEQRRLKEFVATGPVNPQCEAYADSTGERCQRDAMEPFPYCSDHTHLLDEVDLRRMGLKPPKSGG